MRERLMLVTNYKPSSADCNVFIYSIQNILSTINQSKICDLVLYGDFNIDLLYKDYKLDFICEQNVFTVASANYQ